MNFAIDLVNALLTLIVKPTLIIALLIYVIHKPGFRSAAATHWLLLMAILSPLLVILFFVTFPAVDLDVLPQSLAAYTEQDVISIAHGPFEAPNVVTLLFVFGYVSGVVYVFTSMCTAIFRTRNLSRTAKRESSVLLSKLQKELSENFSVSRQVSIRVSEKINAPVMWGYFSPEVLLPLQYVNWTEDRLRRVLSHEYAHIARSDWGIKLLTRSVCAIFWINPIIWYVARQSAWYAELACDDLVVNKLNCRAEYADDLLELSTDASHQFAALAFIKKSELYRRIHAVLDGAKNRSAPGRLLKFVNVFALGLLILPISIIQAKYILAPLQFNFSEPPHKVLIKDTEEFETVEQGEDVQAKNLSLKNLQDKYRVRVEPLEDSPYVLKQVLIEEPEAKELASQKSQYFPEEEERKAGMELQKVSVEPYKSLNKIVPRYPPRALRRNIEGVVVVQLDLDIQGKVHNPKIISNDSSKLFNRSVLKAVKKFSYRPMTINGKAIITKNVQETFVFKIADTTDTSISYR